MDKRTEEKLRKINDFMEGPKTPERWWMWVAIWSIGGITYAILSSP